MSLPHVPFKYEDNPIGIPSEFISESACSWIINSIYSDASAGRVL